jgi:hypothetical protein
MRQALLAEGREVPNIREEDREIDFFSLAGGSSFVFVEVEDNDVLCVVEETTNDHIALDASLTCEARAFIPAAPGCYLLFDLAQRRNIGKAVQDLNTAGCAAAVAAALMKVWDPMADGDVKECLAPWDVFERHFVKVSDSWHDRFPAQIAASLSIIVPRIGFPGNPEPLPQVFDGRPSMPKPCRAVKYGSICRTNRRAIHNSLVASTGFRQQVLCRYGCFFSRDRFLIKYRRIFSRREFSPSIRKDVKATFAVRPWVTGLAAKADRMNDKAQAIFSRTDEPGDQRKILDAAGGET